VLVALRGGANRVRVPVFARRSPRGTWAGSPVVNNDGTGSPTLSQTGSTLYVRGFSPFATYKAGDLFNLGLYGQLLMVKSSGLADSNGWAALSVEPPIPFRTCGRAGVDHDGSSGAAHDPDQP
jgi:hypothetical protein